MSRNNLANRKYRYWIRLQWAPVLRAARTMAIATRQAPKPQGQSLLRIPEVRTAAQDLMSAARAWHAEWSEYRIASGRGFMTPESPPEPPKDHFQRLQRACKAYGHSLRKYAGKDEKQQALLELLNCAMEAPLGQGPFKSDYSSLDWCKRTLKQFPDLAQTKLEKLASQQQETPSSHSQ